LCERGPPVKKPYAYQVVVDRIRRMRAGSASRGSKPRASSRMTG
jgi:hypothetical protein